MHSIGTLPRMVVHALLLALATAMLLAFGCTAVQATPKGPSATSLAAPWDSTSAAAPVDSTSATAPWDSTSAITGPVTATSVTTAEPAGPVSTACVPGRDTVRLERNAVALTAAQLQHSPASAGTAFFARVLSVTATEPLSGRIPAAPTHLDLGIVRT